MRILIVDSERMLRDQLKRVLGSQRYMVDTARDDEEASDKLIASSFDLVILELALPGKDGFSLLREIRSAGLSMLVLILTAHDEVKDKIKGLDLGADDYLTKPFSLEELLARIRALFRRLGGQTNAVLQTGNLSLNTVTRDVVKNGRLISLTAREFSLLEFLLYNKDRVVSRFNLAEHVWGDEFDPFSMSNFMDVHIKNLRRKIGDTGQGDIIRTLRGVGYMIRDAIQ